MLIVNEIDLEKLKIVLDMFLIPNSDPVVYMKDGEDLTEEEEEAIRYLLEFYLFRNPYPYSKKLEEPSVWVAWGER